MGTGRFRRAEPAKRATEAPDLRQDEPACPRQQLTRGSRIGIIVPGTVVRERAIWEESGRNVYADTFLESLHGSVRPIKFDETERSTTGVVWTGKSIWFTNSTHRFAVVCTFRISSVAVAVKRVRHPWHGRDLQENHSMRMRACANSWRTLVGAVVIVFAAVAITAETEGAPGRRNSEFFT